MLSFRLVSIPVRLYPATEPHQPSFHEVEKATADRIRHQRVNERTGHEPEYSDMIKGTSTGGGSSVLLSQDELDETAPGDVLVLKTRFFADEMRTRARRPAKCRAAWTCLRRRCRWPAT